MIQSLNGKQLLSPPGAQARFTAERVLRTRPKTYRAIVKLLADPDAKIEPIAKQHRVSTHTVRAIREREAKAIAERKQRLISIFGNVAEIAAERMEELASGASLRDAGTTAGIATDKLLALSGDASLTIRHEHLQCYDVTNDDLIAFAVAMSHANEEQQQRLKSIGTHGFGLARSRLQQAQCSQKVIEAEIVTDTSVGGDAGDTSTRRKNAAQKEG